MTASLMFCLAQGLQLSRSVDGVYAYNVNRPADHAKFLPGLGTSAKRDNEVTVNLAQVDVVLAPEPVGSSCRWASAPRPKSCTRRRSGAPPRAPTYGVTWSRPRCSVRPSSVAGCWSRTKYSRATSVSKGSLPRTTRLHPVVAGRAVAVLPGRVKGRLPAQRPLVGAAAPAERLAGDRRQQPWQEPRHPDRVQRGSSRLVNGIVGPELAGNDADGGCSQTWS